jgi:hypothetical protein
MPRADLDFHFNQIDQLTKEIEVLVPESGGYQAVKFRADLAGLLVVAIAATYETCVKEIRYEYANGRHADFGGFAQRNYEKLNSRIAVEDLKRYCDLFGPQIKHRFNQRLGARRSKILKRVGQDIVTCYRQILTWRHDFAHALNRNATIKEVIKTHSFGRRVLYVFDDAFFCP